MDDAEKSTSAAAADPPTQEASISNWPSTLHPTIESLLSSPAELPQDSSSLADGGVFCVPGSDQYQDLFLLRAPSSNVVETIRDLLENFRSDDCDRPGRFAFYNVSPADFKKFNEEEPRVRKCKLTYLASELGGLLSFKMPSDKHDLAADMVVAHLLKQADGMWLDNILRSIANSTLPIRDGKEADQGIRTHFRRSGTQPTLVIEVGNSQSKPSLLTDKDIYFQQTDWVNIVILVKIFANTRRTVEVELWRRGDLQAASTVKVGLTAPLSQDTELPRRTTWDISGAPMHVSYEDVVDRGKEEDDADFTFSEEFFIKMACEILAVCPKTPPRVVEQYSAYLVESRAQAKARMQEMKEKEARQKEQDDKARQDNDVRRNIVALEVEEMGVQDEQIRLMEKQMRQQDEQMRLMEKQIRLKGEQMDLQEQVRLQDEQMRLQDEQMRLQDEQMRLQNEQMRLMEKRIRLRGEQLRLLHLLSARQG